MCFGPEEPEITYDGPTKSDAANLEIARENQGLYNQYFKGMEGQYLRDIQENMAGFAENQAAADTAQAVATNKQASGPVLANRGQATGMMGTYAAAHGSGLAAGVTEADTLGKQSIIDKNMIALQNASGLGSNISSNAQQLATKSTTAANQAANITFQADKARYADTSALMADVAGAAAYGAGNYAKTGSLLGNDEGVKGLGAWGANKGTILDKIGRRMGGGK